MLLGRRRRRHFQQGTTISDKKTVVNKEYIKLSIVSIFIISLNSKQNINKSIQIFIIHLN